MPTSHMPFADHQARTRGGGRRRAPSGCRSRACAARSRTRARRRRRATPAAARARRTPTAASRPSAARTATRRSSRSSSGCSGTGRLGSMRLDLAADLRHELGRRTGGAHVERDARLVLLRERHVDHRRRRLAERSRTCCPWRCPTISIHGPFAPAPAVLKRLPSASSPGKNSFTIVSLTIATSGRPSTSWLVEVAALQDRNAERLEEARADDVRERLPARASP